MSWTIEHVKVEKGQPVVDPTGAIHAFTLIELLLVMALLDLAKAGGFDLLLLAAVPTV